MSADVTNPDSSVQPPQRPVSTLFRRPWWKWNLATLAVVLFVLAWVRELTQLSPRLTWTLVLGVFTAWFVLPDLLPRGPQTVHAVVERFRRIARNPIVIRVLVAMVLAWLWYLVLAD